MKSANLNKINTKTIFVTMRMLVAPMTMIFPTNCTPESFVDV